MRLGVQTLGLGFLPMQPSSNGFREPSLVMMSYISAAYLVLVSPQNAYSYLRVIKQCQATSVAPPLNT